jgi:hypothetical protein
MKRFFESEHIDVPCTVEIEHSARSLHAHVEIDGDIGMKPGDEVLVHDAPIAVPFGESRVVRRMVTIIRAGLLKRISTRLASNFELNQLFEVSFSERTKL